MVWVFSTTATTWLVLNREYEDMGEVVQLTSELRPERILDSWATTLSSLDGLEYERTVLVNDDLCFIELETLQGITSIHLVPKRFGPQAVKEIREVFDQIRDAMRQDIPEIYNMIDPSSKLDKLHKMFGFTRVGTWKNLDVYHIYC